MSETFSPDEERWVLLPNGNYIDFNYPERSIEARETEEEDEYDIIVNGTRAHSIQGFENALEELDRIAKALGIEFEEIYPRDCYI